MKSRTTHLFIATATFLTVFSARAQFTYSFVTPVSNGTFTLHTNNLVAIGADGNSVAGYVDTQDTLTFDGHTYTNLNFTVYNNSDIISGYDGFQILVNKSPYNSDSLLELDASGSSSLVSGDQVSDLVTALNSLNGGVYIYTVQYPSFYQETGSFNSFQLLPSISNFGMQTNQIGFNIIGGAGTIVVIDACTNLTNPVWLPIQTNTLTSGSCFFSDPMWTNYPSRYYRVNTQ